MQECPVSFILKHLSGKWKFDIIWRLSRFKTLRFNELQRQLPGISAQVLSRKLQELIDLGIVHKKNYDQIPPKVEYSLTEIGLQLRPCFDKLGDVGKEIQSFQLKKMN
ncbi:helix-turn-helix domain-containing protein [Lachnospiraceae bacterium 54-53]